MNSIDWSSLSSGLLHAICTKLAEIIYVIRFRAVCKTWRSSFSLSYPSTFLPWILVYQENPIRNEDLQFYSPFSVKTYNIHVPQALGTRLMGPAKGYLLCYKYSDVSLTLLNPFTANEISLPPLQDEIRYPLNAFITPQSDDKIIILGQKDKDLHILSLGISKPGDKHWLITRIKTSNRKYGACAVYNNMCFLSETSKRCTSFFDSETGDIVSTIPNFKKRIGEEALEYLVVSGGKLLRILINNFKHTEQLSLDVYELDGRKAYRWLEIKDIGDHILFLDKYDSFSLTSRELHGLRGNCIYFFSHKVVINNEGEKRCLLHRYELGNGNIETLGFPFMRCGTWVMPSTCNYSRL